MARVGALVRDLMLGSEGGGGAAGGRPRGRLRGVARVGVVVSDPTVADLRGRRRLGRRGDAATLGFYPHVDVETRRRAEAAGFDLVVPRPRMAREPPDLVERLLAP